ncbi:hypothetical protein D9Q98_002729 [Chlorella vulgaris]|uniref:Uncharacterized protein n=1 Tax=Chlorella vulgaris TaxID=3077 RepID=A0A9D4Z006_CHLVU|nr:hypothetical protein D9Q98_002729 [Chlorella vulgaris]
MADHSDADSRELYQPMAIYKHNGETYMIRGLHSVEEVGVVRNVLTVKEWLDEAPNVAASQPDILDQLLGGLSGSHPRDLYRAELDRCSFTDVMVQLQDCARCNEGLSATAGSAGGRLLLAAMQLGFASVAMLILLVDPKAARS